MNHRFSRYAVAAAALAAITGTLAFAQSRGAFPGRRAFLEQRFSRMADSLGLSDAQREKVKGIFEQARQQSEPIRAQLEQNRAAIADAVKSGKSDAELQTLSTSTGVLAGQLLTIHTQAMSKAYALLTPDQKQKADEMHEQIRSRLQGLLGRHPGV